jgi:ABC-type multidrug transport system ATPase subunit
MNKFAVECIDITKQYGHLYALRKLKINIEIGEIVGILGHNGAGKSTFLKIIGTHLSPTAGSLNILGNDAKKVRSKVRRSIGFVGHTSFMYDELTSEENLRFYGKMFSIYGESLEKKIDQVLDQVDIDKYRYVAIKKLSHGLRKRVDLARIFLHSPEILILDEPFSGLDQTVVETLVDLLKKQSGVTSLLSSHSSELLKEFCGRMLTFSEGKLVNDTKGD